MFISQSDFQLRSGLKDLEYQMERIENLPRIGKAQKEIYLRAQRNHAELQAEIDRRAAL